MSLSNPEIPLTMIMMMKLAQRLEQELADSPSNPWSKWLL
jgi:hypothetical protein